MRRVDPDPQETAEWVESLDAVTQARGRARARYLLRRLIARSQEHQIVLPELVQTPYINTIPVDREPAYPGDERIERKIRRIIRWNAVALVVRANHRSPGIGGHLATYASAATLYEVGFNHFFRGKENGGAGDQIFFQGHSSPGIYARAFVEGLISRDHMERFRREALETGLSSYPHPWLMPQFWEFPTVSMGLGPIAAIYQARFNRYLRDRGIIDTDASRVWAFVGDGETDEPEALGSMTMAGREGLDNLVFVVNCNLQRLDGPVRGNGKIIQELEAAFRGSGWNVLKVIWGRDWDPLLANDGDGLLVRRMGDAVDGDYQKYSVEPGSYTREHFFGADPRLLKLVEHLTDEQIRKLRRGGHDAVKVHAAYLAACNHKGAPTAILAKTVKGWTLGEGAEGRNVAHQQKKIGEQQLKTFRDLLELPIPDDQLVDAPFYHPGKNSEELEYLRERRRRLGGSLPKRVVKPLRLDVPALAAFPEMLAGSGKMEATTTRAFAQMLSTLLKDPKIGRRIVPIIPDEARTFGLDALFERFGIYSSVGQLYTPVDSDMLIKYREAKDGQVLEEGITEAGSMATFMAAGTSYATHATDMIPFYIFYAMFGFQRTADQIWAAADARTRGFLLGATAGRTTLNGEGLQHEDGQSHLFASAVPTVQPYDPAFAYELAVILQDGLRRMYEKREDIFYYITLYNEAYPMPPMPAGAEEGILKGLYLCSPAPTGVRRGSDLEERRGSDAAARASSPAPAGARRATAATGSTGPTAQLLGSGPLLREALRAQALLAEKFGVAAGVWSATSYTLLRRDALSVERWNMLHPQSKPRVPYVERCLAKTEGPIIAVSDYIRAVQDQIARWLPGRLFSLGTDGFGRSDTRQALRRFFEVDAECITVATLSQLARAGKVPASEVARAIREFGIEPERAEPAQS
ncbi:MAG: pyruvate dehydrogenase (acetyl-transferring), homodimeric type [Planctomycetes bacterium]|nr:pyruvate dehydrogenase (acetyl-transferring), homodimeric type [Planctomycetota bacterium]